MMTIPQKGSFIILIGSSDWLMETKSGAFVHTTFIRPCLGFDLWSLKRSNHLNNWANPRSYNYLAFNRFICYNLMLANGIVSVYVLILHNVALTVFYLICKIFTSKTLLSHLKNCEILTNAFWAIKKLMKSGFNVVFFIGSTYLSI